MLSIRLAGEPSTYSVLRESGFSEPPHRGESLIEHRAAWRPVSPCRPPAAPVIGIEALPT